MIEWLTVLFDSRVFMKANAILGFVLLGFFIFFYFSREGREEARYQPIKETGYKRSV